MSKANSHPNRDPLLETKLKLHGRLDDLLSRQELAWDKGLQPTVETLIVDLAPGEDRDSVLLELICNEVALRELAGERPALEEYQLRFPTLAKALSIQWEIDQLLVGDRLADAQSKPDTLTDSMVGRSTGKFGQQRGCRSLVDDRDASNSSDASKADRQVTQFDRYELVREVGRGAIGVVYEAWDPILKRTVALKRIRGGVDADQSEIERITVEAESIAKIRHPNIVHIYDIGRHFDRVFLAMEFCSGGNLADRLKLGPLNARQCAELVAKIADGVSAAHACRIIHRDLKPSNILLSTQSELIPKVADFGLAKCLDDDQGATATGSIVGTPAYMAPEQAFGNSKYSGPATDIYSVGAILYECLTGVPPFRSASLAQLLDQVRNNAPTAIRRIQPNVPRDLETIAMTCLSKEPYNRYANAAELAADLGRFLRGEPIHAKQEKTTAKIVRLAKRNPAAFVCACLAVAMLVIVTVGSLVFAQRLNSEKLESNRQRDSAMRARNVTREALDAMTSSFALSSLEQQASVSPEQRQFLQQALKYYSEFAEETNSDIESADYAASAAERVAWIHHRLGDRYSARIGYEEAIDQLRVLTQRFPKISKYQKRLAALQCSLGSCWSNFGERQLSYNAFVNSLSAQQTYLKMEPSDHDGWIELGKIQHNFALQLRDQAKYDQSKQLLQDSVGTFLEVEGRFKATSKSVLELASAQASLGLEEASRGEWNKSKSLLNSSVDRLEGLIANNADDRRAASLLGWCLYNYAIALSSHREYAEANMRFSEALRILEHLSQKYPSIAQYRQDYSSTLISYSGYLLSQKKHSEALVYGNKALTVVETFLSTTPNSRDFLWVQGDALRTIARIHLDQNQIELATQKFVAALEAWMLIEKNRSGSAELYTSHHEQFQMDAAFASGFVAAERQESERQE